MARVILRTVRAWLQYYAMLILGSAFGIYIGFMIYTQLRGEITKAQWLESGAVLLLVLVTAVYVERTGRIAVYTKQQTDEMREQREQALLPILVAKCEYLADTSDSQIYQVYVQNIGPGPALDIGVTKVNLKTSEIRVVWAVGRREEIPIPRKNMWDIGELASGDKSDINDSITISIGEEEKFNIVIECKDTYGHLIGALREFEVFRNRSEKLEIKEIHTFSAQRIKERIRDYPRLEVIF